MRHALFANTPVSNAYAQEFTYRTSSGSVTGTALTCTLNLSLICELSEPVLRIEGYLSEALCLISCRKHGAPPSYMRDILCGTVSMDLELHEVQRC